MFEIIAMIIGGVILVMFFGLMGMFVVDFTKWVRQGIEAYRTPDEDTKAWERFIKAL